MTRARALAGLLLAFVLMVGPAGAVEPGEMLADPALERRAREISSELRCLVCQNQSIDDSDAALARDLRVLVRERLLAGDGDSEVIAYLVSRYGEFVLLRPRISLRNGLLWGAPVLLLGMGAVFIWQSSRRRNNYSVEPLGASEIEKLKRIL